MKKRLASFEFIKICQKKFSTEALAEMNRKFINLSVHSEKVVCLFLNSKTTQGLYTKMTTQLFNHEIESSNLYKTMVCMQ